jgi:hypothetical protein
MMTDLDLDTRQIINYLRKNTSDNKNEQYMRKILYSLFYSSYLDFPIAILNNEEELKYIYSELPYIFQKKNKNEIIDIYNKYVKPKKQILIHLDLFILIIGVKLLLIYIKLIYLNNIHFIMIILFFILNIKNFQH